MSDHKHILLDFENINDYSIQFNRWFLISLGVWPQTSALSRMKKIVVSMQIFIFTTAVAVITVPCMLYVCFEKVHIKTKLNVFVPLIHRTMGCVNYWMLITYNKSIQQCLQHMETDWQLVRKMEDREVMLHYAKIGRFIAGFCAIFMHGSTFIYSVARVAKTITFTVGNETFKMYSMTCPMYSKIIDPRFSPTNEILLGVQLFSAFVMASAIVNVCSLAGVLAMHACGQLNVLHAWLKDLAEEKQNHLAEQKLATVVEHHLRVLSFIAQIESIMHKTCLVELMGSTMNMCLLGYYSIMVKINKTSLSRITKNWGAFDGLKIMSYFITYISMTFNIFIFCYIGEVLAEQSRNVGEIAYMTNWYKLPHKTALGFILIIIRSSRLIKITAGKIFRLSIATFGDIIKTSLAYLNFLRTITA